MKTDITYFKTSDLALTTTISLYRQIEAIDRSDAHRFFFHFSRDSELDQIVEAYHRCELKIEPQRYFSQLKAIKSRLYSND